MDVAGRTVGRKVLYLARVWISESGKIYTTHEYDSVVHSFASIVDLMEWKLSKQALDYITIRTVQN